MTFQIAYGQSMWAERKTERSGRKMGWAGGSGAVSGCWKISWAGAKRAKSAVQTPLTPKLCWFSDWYLTLKYPRSVFYYSISILALTIFQFSDNNWLYLSLFVTDYLLKYVDEMHRFLVVMEIESVARLTFLRKSMWASERSGAWAG